jgi:signal transduction histidine kinase
MLPRAPFHLLLVLTLIGSPVPTDAAGQTAAADGRAYRILLIAGDDPAQPYVQEIYEGFRDALAAAATHTLLFREFYDVVRFGDRPEYGGEYRSWLHQKYRDRHVDVLVVTQQSTLELLAEVADGPWQGIPVVVGTLGTLPDEVAASHANASGIILENHYAQFLHLITSVLPGTRTIAVIRGTSAVERERDSPLLAEIARQGLGVQDLGESGMDDILRRVADLPVDTVPILMGFQVDATGRLFQADQAMKLVAGVANRPVFSINPADIGTGATGGLFFGTRLLGRQLAEAALARLAGEGPRTVAIPAQQHASAVFDARQLSRWGISEARVPAGSSVRYREPSLWRDYRGTVIATIGVGATQMLLIVGVLVQRHHHASAQAALATSYGQLRHLTGRLITAQEEERARIARNLHDDIGQRVASFSIALSGARRMAGDAEPLRNELTSLQQEATSLSGELRDLSHDLHPGVLEHLGLLEALRSRCDEVTDESGTRCRLEVANDWRDVPDAVALCLYRVAQEALRNVSKHAAARNVVVSLDQQDGIVSMQVADDGRGFVAEKKQRGLGLLSLGERVGLLGGSLNVTSTPTAGTKLAVTLPMDGVSHAA